MDTCAGRGDDPKLETDQAREHRSSLGDIHDRYIEQLPGALSAVLAEPSEYNCIRGAVRGCEHIEHGGCAEETVVEPFSEAAALPRTVLPR